jgi:cysteine desulfurase
VPFHGLATAVEIAVADAPRTAALAALRDDLVARVLVVVPDARLNRDPGTGAVDGGPSRLTGNVHVSLPGCEGESVLMQVDAHGVECSTGSACSTGVAQPSRRPARHGYGQGDRAGSLRFCLGHTSTPPTSTRWPR